MDKNKAMEWVQALRSGKYKQGKTRLKYKDAVGNISYCCLGVLGEINGVLNLKGQDYLHSLSAATCSLASETGKSFNRTDGYLSLGVKLYLDLAQANDQG